MFTNLSNNYFTTFKIVIFSGFKDPSVFISGLSSKKNKKSLKYQIIENFYVNIGNNKRF